MPIRHALELIGPRVGRRPHVAWRLRDPSRGSACLRRSSADHCLVPRASSPTHGVPCMAPDALDVRPAAPQPAQSEALQVPQVVGRPRTLISQRVVALVRGGAVDPYVPLRDPYVPLRDRRVLHLQRNCATKSSAPGRGSAGTGQGARRSRRVAAERSRTCALRSWSTRRKACPTCECSSWLRRPKGPDSKPSFGRTTGCRSRATGAPPPQTPGRRWLAWPERRRGSDWAPWSARSLSGCRSPLPKSSRRSTR